VSPFGADLVRATSPAGNGQVPASPAGNGQVPASPAAGETGLSLDAAKAVELT
jgi:hypothetical protein